VKVAEKVWEALVQSQVRFNRVPEKVPVKVWEASVPSQVRFNRDPRKGSGEGLGGFGAVTFSTEFRRMFRRRLREALVQSRVRFNRVLKKVPEKVWEALVQSQVRFNRVPEKFGGEPGHRVLETVLKRFGRLWCGQVRFNRVPEKVPENVPGSLGAKPSQFNGFCRRFRRRFR